MMFSSLKQRLENWGKCQRGGAGGGLVRAKETRSASPYGGQGYKCMTGVICNMLETAATGPAGWRPMKSELLDRDDAKIVTSAWVRLSERPKAILKWCYILNKPPGEICRHLGIRQWPASHFKAELIAAEDAIQKLLDSQQRKNTIPSNNSIPSGVTCGSPQGGSTDSDETEKALD